MSMGIMQPVIKGRIDMWETMTSWETITSWNWTNIFLGFISLWVWYGFESGLKKLGDIENRIVKIENKLGGNVNHIAESISRIEHNTRP
jgi:hypothetical protein